MKLWILIIVTLMFQELVSTNVVLLDALQHGYNFWIINSIFVITTAVGILIGYWLGKWIQKIFHKSKAVVYFEKRAKKLNDFMGINGTRLSLIFLSIIDFNFMDSFLAAWLPISFWEVFIFLFIGNLIWYACLLLLIFGVNTYIKNPYETFSILIGISVVLTIVFRLISRKLLKNK